MQSESPFTKLSNCLAEVGSNFNRCRARGFFNEDSCSDFDLLVVCEIKADRNGESMQRRKPYRFPKRLNKNLMNQFNVTAEIIFTKNPAGEFSKFFVEFPQACQGADYDFLSMHHLRYLL